MAHQLKFFLDKELTEPLKKLKFPTTEIGHRSEMIFYMANTSEKWPILEIKHNKTDEDVTVEDIPQILKPKASAKVKAVWKPTVETDDPLNGILDISSELHVGSE